MLKFHELFHHNLYTKELMFVRFLTALGISGIGTLWPLYLNSLGVADATIGFIQTIVLLVGIGVSFFVPTILKRYQLAFILFISVSVTGFLIMGMSFTTELFILVGLLLFSTFFASLRDNSFGILYRDLTKRKAYTFFQGLLYMILNVSWIIGPVLFTYLASVIEFAGALFFVGLTYLLGGIMVKSFHLPDTHKTAVGKKFSSKHLSRFKEFFGKSELRNAYIVTAALQFWWMVLYVFVPLHLVKLGATIFEIGIFLSFLSVPLIVIEFLVGKYATPKRYQQLLRIGFFALALLGIVPFFVTNVGFIMILFIASSIFSALIEPLKECLFFQNVSKRNEEAFTPIYLTSLNVGGIIASLLLSSIIAIYSLKWIFIATSLLLFCIVFVLRPKQSK